MPITTTAAQTLFNTQEGRRRTFNLITNYIYFYHTNSFILLPVYPDSVTDTSQVNFASTPLLARSAPIYSFSNAGPRTVQINLNLHRDLMTETNYQNSNVNLDIGDDYVDVLIRSLQAMALPRYDASAKLVDPPIVAIRLGNEIYCKGVVVGSVSTTYQLPILENDKYSQVSVAFTISEIDPYDADIVMRTGSFRGLNTTLERSFWTNGDIPTNFKG